MSGSQSESIGASILSIIGPKMLLKVLKSAKITNFFSTFLVRFLAFIGPNNDF